MVEQDIVRLSAFVSAAIGIIVTVLYYIDSWQPASAPDTPLHKTPRFRGLIYLLSGTALTGIPSGIAQDPSLVLYYLSSLVLSFLSIGTIFVFYGVIYSYNKLYELYPWKAKHWLFVETWPHSMRLLKNGWEHYHKTLDDLINYGQIKQRDRISNFSKGFYNGVVALHSRNKHGVVEFKNLVEVYLEIFLRVFLEHNASGPNRYRACVLWLDQPSSEFRLFVGVSPHNIEHSGIPIPQANSLAGHAFSNPKSVHYYPAHSEHATVPFFHRPTNSSYKSVIARAITTIGTDELIPNSMILAIDSKDKTPAAGIDFLDESVAVFATGIAHARALFGISDEIVKTWLDSQHTDLTAP